LKLAVNVTFKSFNLGFVTFDFSPILLLFCIRCECSDFSSKISKSGTTKGALAVQYYQDGDFEKSFPDALEKLFANQITKAILIYLKAQFFTEIKVATGMKMIKTDKGNPHTQSDIYPRLPWVKLYQKRRCSKCNNKIF